ETNKSSGTSDLSELSFEEFSAEKKDKSSIDLEKELDQKLEKLYSLVNTTRDEILQEIEIKNSNFEQSPNKDIGNNFKKILQKKYENKEKNDQGYPQKYRKVFKLADKGQKARDIARNLNLGIRETRLILKLYENENKEEKNEGQIKNVSQY
ncbi:MAG: DUF6115 domain-containing protein, partial [Halanaerobiales bacterium]